MSAMFRKQRSASRIYESYTRLKDDNEFLCGCSHLCSHTSKSLSILRAVSVPWQLKFKAKFKGARYDKERIQEKKNLRACVCIENLKKGIDASISLR